MTHSNSVLSERHASRAVIPANPAVPAHAMQSVYRQTNLAGGAGTLAGYPPSKKRKSRYYEGEAAGLPDELSSKGNHIDTPTELTVLSRSYEYAILRNSI